MRESFMEVTEASAQKLRSGSCWIEDDDLPGASVALRSMEESIKCN